MGQSLKGRPRRRAIAQVRASEPDCWLCGFGIDLTLDAQVDPMGSSVDEIIPRWRGGSTTDRENLRHAHRICNSTRGGRTVTVELLRELRTLAAAQLGITLTSTSSRSW